MAFLEKYRKVMLCAANKSHKGIKYFYMYIYTYKRKRDINLFATALNMGDNISSCSSLYFALEAQSVLSTSLSYFTKGKRRKSSL